MADEKEEHYEEEGEYHFSDDQVNYDIEPESPKAKSSPGFNKEAILEKFTQNRRRILGAVSLFVLIGVVYKILVPANTSTPPTEFNQAAAAAAAKAMPPATTVTKVKTIAAAQPVTAPTAPPSAAQTPAVQNMPPPVNAQQNQPPVATVTVTSPIASASLPPNAAQSLPTPAAGMPPMGIPPATNQTGAQSAMPPPIVAANPVNTGSFDVQTKDRLTALEQQNTAMMNLLQTEYAQKIADAETQSNAVRGRMEELTKRVNRMETSLNQITQLLQGMSKSQASGPMYNAASRSPEPRMIYSVQAIIPGRAWLKSESGDTVTVAEGDYLKKYGRVTKIDPYDGVVSIDTGNKVIMLSYGLDGG